jgi:hypothetical protein
MILLSFCIQRRSWYSVSRIHSSVQQCVLQGVKPTARHCDFHASFSANCGSDRYVTHSPVDGWLKLSSEACRCSRAVPPARPLATRAGEAEDGAAAGEPPRISSLDVASCGAAMPPSGVRHTEASGDCPVPFDASGSVHGGGSMYSVSPAIAKPAAAVCTRSWCRRPVCGSKRKRATEPCSERMRLSTRQRV